MPSFITNEWTAITDGAWYLREGDVMRVRIEWGVEAVYTDVASEDSLPGGPWKLRGVNVVSDDYLELHFKPATVDEFNTALMAGVPSKRELLAASLYGATYDEDSPHILNARSALAAADALIAEASKK